VGEGRAPDFCGKRVVVVGGGNVAMDATRTSMRLGAASVKCVYRRRIADMTALPEEIEGAAAEGCEIVQLMSPVRIEADEKTGNVTALVVKPQLSGPYEKGRPKPVDSDMPEERIPCDIIVVAIGQKIDSAPFEKAGMAANRGAFITGEDMSVSNMDGVFAGGDCVFGPATVIRAIEAGKVAAANIDKYLGYSHMISVDVDIPEASYKYTPAHGRASMQERAAGERKRDFDLMEKGMTAESAALECSRCLRCDHFGCGAFKGGRTTKW
jgi:NADPH-dependent glutamate synthase beta subunit-like oxidoreductase